MHSSACSLQVVYERLTRQQSLDLLRQHLTANLVRLCCWAGPLVRTGQQMLAAAPTCPAAWECLPPASLLPPINSMPPAAHLPCQPRRYGCGGAGAHRPVASRRAARSARCCAGKWPGVQPAGVCAPPFVAHAGFFLLCNPARHCCSDPNSNAFPTFPCSLYLAHLERTRLAPLLQLHTPADPGAAGQGPLPHEQQAQQGRQGAAAANAAAGAAAAAAGAGCAGHGASVWASSQAATPADRLVGGVPTVVCLSEGEGAALCPATVLAATPSGAGAGGSSKGLLTELAKAAESLTTAPSASQATLQTGGQPPAPSRRRPASAGSGGGIGNGSGGSWGSRGAAGGAALTGDLLLLPAGAQPAGPATAAAAAVTAGTSVRGGIASPVTAGTTLQQPQVTGAAGEAAAAGAGGAAGAAGAVGATSPLLSPRSTPSQPPVLAQLGCSRLAMHAGSVLLRLVDDFLLVTAIPSVARSFALAMLEGGPAVWLFACRGQTHA